MWGGLGVGGVVDFWGVVGLSYVGYDGLFWGVDLFVFGCEDVVDLIGVVFVGG